MNFGRDFVEILQTHKRLPFPSIEESMATINQLQQEVEKLKAENERLKQAAVHQRLQESNALAEIKKIYQPSEQAEEKQVSGSSLCCNAF